MRAGGRWGRRRLARPGRRLRPDRDRSIGGHRVSTGPRGRRVLARRRGNGRAAGRPKRAEARARTDEAATWPLRRPVMRLSFCLDARFRERTSACRHSARKPQSVGMRRVFRNRLVPGGRQSGCLRSATGPALGVRRTRHRGGRTQVCRHRIQAPRDFRPAPVRCR